jgi:hypothetical protein
MVDVNIARLLAGGVDAAGGQQVIRTTNLYYATDRACDIENVSDM